MFLRFESVTWKIKRRHRGCAAAAFLRPHPNLSPECGRLGEILFLRFSLRRTASKRHRTPDPSSCRIVRNTFTATGENI